MKKILCILVLILAVACVLSACNQSSSPSVETTSTTPEETTPAVTTPQETTPEETTPEETTLEETTPEETTPEKTTPEVPDEPFTPSVGLAYEVNEDGETCTITGIGTCTDTDIYIGGSIDGYKVTSIGDQAFYRCTSLTSVTIGDSVKSIGYEAVFAACSSLTSIVVDKDNTAYQSINGNLYSKDGKTLIAYAVGKTDKSFTILDSVTSIGNSAFWYCISLTSVTIGDSVKSIGDYAFRKCTSLTSVTIGDSVTSIGYRAFFDCTSLTNVTIGDSVTSIGANAFEDCNSLTSVTIPDSVTSIGDYAFWYCISLTSVTIPDSVTSIGYGAFSDCNNLVGNEYDNAYYLGNDQNPYLLLLRAKSRMITSCTIHKDTRFIYYSAFSSCYSLTSVTIGDSVTSIGNYAFEDCISLTSVTFANPNGWWYAYSADATSGTAIAAESLADPATAAKYLKSSTYDNYYWFRTE